MLQNIRDNAQGWLAWIIVFLISIPFALWGIHEYLRPTPKRTIAEVNGVELSERDFQRQVSQRQQQLRAMLQNQDIDLSFMTTQIKESTLNQMIEEEVLVQSAIDAGMRIGDALLVKRIQKLPAFQEEGDFSQQLYEQVLRYQGTSPTGFEQDIRRAMLTDQMREGVLRSAILTDYDQQQYHRLEEQQRLISYLIIPTERFKATVTLSDPDIETAYQQNANRYMTPEQVSLEYVELSQQDLLNQQEINEDLIEQRYQEQKAAFTTPAQWKARHILIEVDKEATTEQLEAKKNQAQEILTKIRAGDSFEALAQQFSDDIGSKKQGGDLGWFGPNTMVKPFEEAVKAMQVGDISEPVKSQFGFHIIKLEEQKPQKILAFDEVREQLLQELQKEQSESEFYGQVEQFANLAFEHPSSLEVLAQTLHLEIKTTELFDRNTVDTQADSILSHRKIINVAFSDAVLKERYNSDVIDLGEQHVVVIRVKDYEPAELKPLDEVKEEIISTLTQEKTKTEAETLGQTLLDQIKNQVDPEDVVKTHNLTWSVPQWIKRRDTTLKQPDIVREAFKIGRPTANHALYQSLKLGNGDYALVMVLAVKDAETPLDTQNSEQLQQTLGESEFNQFVSELKSASDIKNYSEQLSES